MSVQGSVNQLLALTTGAVGLFGKTASDQALVNAIQERELAKQYSNQADKGLVEQATKLNNLPLDKEQDALESEIGDLNKQGKTYNNSDEVKGKRDLVNDISEVKDAIDNEELFEGTISPMSAESELELRKKYGNKGMIGKRKIVKKLEQDRYSYQFNEGVIGERANKYNGILNKVERDIQIREEANKRAEQERQEKQKQMKQLKKTKTSLGELGNLPEHLQNKILEGLKKEEVNKK